MPFELLFPPGHVLVLLGGFQAFSILILKCLGVRFFRFFQFGICSAFRF